jgi:hypothetical protein
MKKMNNLLYARTWLAISLLMAAAPNCWPESTREPNSLLEKFVSLDGAYNARVERFLISEANDVVERLNLSESRPIVSSNKVALYITPPRIAVASGRIGNITTSNYLYGAAEDRKLSLVMRSFGGVRDGLGRYYEMLKENYSLPPEQKDTNAAISLARRWLGDFGVSLKRLDKETVVETRVWTPPNKLVPLYWVTWRNAGTSCVSVELFLPDKSLRQLRVEDSSFIERAQFPITNYSNLDKRYKN